MILRNKNQKGQALIILLLIMLVTLTIGLAVTQRSLSDLSSSNKADQSTRAFSAAEAGIEKALQTGSGTTVTSADLQNQASATVKTSGLLPLTKQPLEYPPIGKDTVAQFWLADPRDPNLNCSATGFTPPLVCYPSSTSGNPLGVDVYWGRSDYQNTQDPDIPAIEVDLITKNSSNFKSYKYFFDPISISGRGSLYNGFADPNCPGNRSPINTSNSPNTSVADRTFRCSAPVLMPVGEQPIMIRARILYSNTAQPIAVVPKNGNSLPPQATIYTSIGSAGQVQKKIQVFKLQYVVPAYFDFAIFSAGDIKK